MAKGSTPSSRSRQLLLVVGILLFMLGVGAAGFGRVENPLLRELDMAESYPPTITVLPGGESPLANQDAIRSRTTCDRRERLDSSPNSTRVSFNEDPRNYLGKMTALRFQRRGGTASAHDPYLASLDPAVYLVNDAPLPIMNVGSSRIALSQTCQVP